MSSLLDYLLQADTLPTRENFNEIQAARPFQWRDIIDHILEKARQLLNLTDSDTNNNSPSKILMKGHASVARP